MLLWDSTIVILIPAILLALYAQMKVRSAFSKYSRVPVRSGLTGAQAADHLLRYQAATEPSAARVASTVGIQPHPGTLSDHYDPRTKALGMRQRREALTERHGNVLLILGLIARLPLLQNIAIWIFAGALAFTLITLPVEFNASSRAVALLQGSGVVAADEVSGVRAVLNAAALTYVAAALMAALQLVRMLMLRRD